MKPIFILPSFFLFLFACSFHNNTGFPIQVIEFSTPVKVEMRGYAGNIMEPFLSRDGGILLFSNLNGAPENTNLHWSTKINDSTFAYRGEIAGVNTTDLEGVPTMDTAGNLYFVSNRSYITTFSTLYQCRFSQGAASDVRLLNGVSKLQPGWVNFDVEVAADGQTLYFVDAQFDRIGNPFSADLIIAVKDSAGFHRLSNSDFIMKNINAKALEYAACISADQLELYFTRTEGATPQIFGATRKNIADAFSVPFKIQAITGFAEAPTISPDQRTLYYHKKEPDRFALYMIRKK